MANLAIGNIEKVRALAANGRVLLVGGARAAPASRLTAYDFAANKVLWSVELPSAVLALALAGERWVAAGADGTVRIGALGDGKVERELAGAHPGGCTGVALSPDSQRLYTVGMDGFLRGWVLDSGKKRARVAGLPAAAARRGGGPEPHLRRVRAAMTAVVRSFTVANGARRDMAGHEGPVRALAFTPRDGRLASAGDDGRIRIWYLVGAVEFEVRGDKDSGHAGPVLALLFPPTPTAEPGQEPGDRFWTAGRRWQGEGVAPGRAPQAAHPRLRQQAAARARLRAAAQRAAGEDDARPRLHRWRGAPRVPLHPGAGGQALRRAAGLRPRLRRRSPSRSAAAAPSARPPCARPSRWRSPRRSTSSSRCSPRTGRPRSASSRPPSWPPEAAPPLAPSCASGWMMITPTVRTAALEALATLEESPLAAPRAALDSRFADIRIAGLRRLAKLAGTSPLVPGLIAGKLTDTDANVGLAALDALTEVSPAGSTEPLKTAFERGPAHIKVEVLIRAASAGQLGAAQLQPLVARALDDSDADVRRVAFTVRVLERRALAQVLEQKDEDFRLALRDVARRGALRQARAAEGQAGKFSTEGEVRPPATSSWRSHRHGQAGCARSPKRTWSRCWPPWPAARRTRPVRGARGLAQLGDAPGAGRAAPALSRAGGPHPPAGGHRAPGAAGPARP